MALSNQCFFSASLLMLVPRFEITGLWWAMIAYVVVRAAVLFRYFPQTLKNAVTERQGW